MLTEKSEDKISVEEEKRIRKTEDKISVEEEKPIQKSQDKLSVQEEEKPIQKSHDNISVDEEEKPVHKSHDMISIQEEEKPIQKSHDKISIQIEEKPIHKSELGKAGKENSLNIKNKNSAKTRIDKHNEDYSFNLTLDLTLKSNKTHLNFNNKKRIAIECYDNIANKKAEGEIETNKPNSIILKNEDRDFDEQERLEKIKRLEELEINNDQSFKETSDKEDKEVIYNTNNELQKTQGSKKTNSKLILNSESKNFISRKSIRSSNKDLYNVEIKISEKNILTKNNSKVGLLSCKSESSYKIKNSISSQNNVCVENMKQESKMNIINENYSQYFEASNQNFYSSAINNENNNNNIENNFNNNLINSTKNVFLGSDFTGNTYNVFSLNSVNNFHSKNLDLNNVESNKFDQSPIINNTSKKIFEENKAETQMKIVNKQHINELSTNKISKDKKMFKTKSKSPKKTNKKINEKQQQNLFYSEEDNYKSKN